MIIFIRLNAFFAKIYKKKDNFLYKFSITVSKIFLSQPVVSFMVEQFTCRQLKKLLQWSLGIFIKIFIFSLEEF